MLSVNFKYSEKSIIKRIELNCTKKIKKNKIRLKLF